MAIKIKFLTVTTDNIIVMMKNERNARVFVQIKNGLLNIFGVLKKKKLNKGSLTFSEKGTQVGVTGIALEIQNTMLFT